MWDKVCVTRLPVSRVVVLAAEIVVVNPRLVRRAGVECGRSGPARGAAAVRRLFAGHLGTSLTCGGGYAQAYVCIADGAPGSLLH
jgi:hypothetical protein